MDDLASLVQPVIDVTNVDGTPMLTSQASEGNQWFRNGVAIVGATDTTFGVSDDGVYTVQVTVSDCSSVMSEEYEIIVIGVEKSAPAITVFPNPVKEVICGGAHRSSFEKTCRGNYY